MSIADVPPPWWAVGLPSGVRPGQESRRESQREPVTAQEREAAYTRFKLARAERALPARPLAPRRGLTPEQRRAYLRQIGVIR